MHKIRKNAIFFLLRSYALNYPIIREQAFILSKAILLSVGEGEGKATLDFLKSDLDIQIDEQMRTNQMVALMMDVNSGFVLYYAVSSKKSIDFLEGLGTMAKTGRFFGTELSAPILIVMEGIPAGVDLHNFFLIFQESAISKASVDMKDVVPADDALPVVFDKIRECCRWENSDLQAWIAAACFLWPQLKGEDRDTVFHSLTMSARALVMKDENNQGVASLGELAVDALYHWQEKTMFGDLIELPDVDEDMKLHIEKHIFFDDLYVYFTNDMFSDITKQLQSTYAFIRLKSALREEGILCSDHSDTYTAKMRYYDVKCDCPRRKRMLRLRRDKLNRVGDIDFVELCLQSGEKEGRHD